MQGSDTLDAEGYAAGQIQSPSIAHGSAVQSTVGEQTPPDAAPPVAPTNARQASDDVLDEDDDEQPTVEHQAWLKQDDYWQRTTYIAVTGRQTAMSPYTRPLPRPERFRKVSAWRSLLILALTIALIVLIPLGVITAQREAATHIKLPSSIPGLTQPTPQLTPSVTPKKN
jgi:hypothetical protein